jgi:hypothetical protein
VYRAAVPRAAAPDAQFDEAYYHRFYGQRRTRVQGPPEVARQCRAILAVARWQGIAVRSVTEIGAGTGLWRDWFARHQPAVRYVSTDVSRFACRQFGHRRLDIAAARLPGRFDLVVCQGVLPYLDEPGALRAIDHLAAMTGELLFLECQTERDLDEVCDLEVSDPALKRRPVAFYRDRLERHLIMLGLGLWAPRAASAGVYQLESGTLAHPAPTRRPKVARAAAGPQRR